jgi:hypothetical protein
MTRYYEVFNRNRQCYRVPCIDSRFRLYISVKCAENVGVYDRINDITQREVMPLLHYSTHIPNWQIIYCTFPPNKI